MLNPEKIWHEYFTDLSTSHVRCSLGKSQKVIFQHYYSYTSDYLRYHTRKQIATFVLQLWQFTYCCLVLPITCIALVLRLGHATGGARVLIWTCWGLRQRFVAIWAELQHSVVYYTIMRLISVEKGWKHVLTRTVVTLNTCCDTACLTFQLPHITTGSFQNHRRQPTTGSLRSEPPTLERTQQTYSQMKNFCSSQVSVGTFSGGVGKWITLCFLLRYHK